MISCGLEVGGNIDDQNGREIQSVSPWRWMHRRLASLFSLLDKQCGCKYDLINFSSHHYHFGAVITSLFQFANDNCSQYVYLNGKFGGITQLWTRELNECSSLLVLCVFADVFLGGSPSLYRGWHIWTNFQHYQPIGNLFHYHKHFGFFNITLPKLVFIS